MPNANFINVTVADEAKPHSTLPGTAQSLSEKMGEDTTDVSSRPEMPLVPQTATIPNGKAQTLEQPVLQAAIAAALAKEGVPLPFVDYPLAKDEPESDTPHRGRWPSSGDEPQGDENQQGSDNNGHPQEERLAANDPNSDEFASDVATEIAQIDNAESYYLKMSNFS